MKQIDKHIMDNDIILTIALIISSLIVTIMSHLTNLYESEYKLPIFIIVSFILIKLIYNVLLHIYKTKNKL